MMSYNRPLLVLIIPIFFSFVLSTESQSNVNSSEEHICRHDNTSTVDCNGRGTCMFGVCVCDKRPNSEDIISGQYCECDNFSCERYEHEICAGPDKGVCECGVCLCKYGWTGSDCSCTTSNESCIPPNGGEICGSNGICVCGKCQCRSTEEGHFYGNYCEYCSTCNRCIELKDCTQCQVYHTGPLKNEEDCLKCTTFTPVLIDKVEIEDETEHLCIFLDEDDCRFKFKYHERDNIIKVIAEIERECPSKIFNMKV